VPARRERFPPRAPRGEEQSGGERGEAVRLVGAVSEAEDIPAQDRPAGEEQREHGGGAGGGKGAQAVHEGFVKAYRNG
jgi:hypothetical protein